MSENKKFNAATWFVLPRGVWEKQDIDVKGSTTKFEVVKIYFTKLNKETGIEERTLAITIPGTQVHRRMILNDNNEKVVDTENALLRVVTEEFKLGGAKRVYNVYNYAEKKAVTVTPDNLVKFLIKKGFELSDNTKQREENAKQREEKKQSDLDWLLNKK